MGNFKAQGHSSIVGGWGIYFLVGMVGKLGAFVFGNGTDYCFGFSLPLVLKNDGEFL